MNGKQWSRSDERLLRQLYPKTATREIARRMGRDYCSVKTRAAVLHLFKAPGHGGKWSWTAKQDKFLRSTYPHVPTKDIAEAIGCSVFVAYQRAVRQGLRKSAAYMAEQHRREADRLLKSGRAHRFVKGQVPVNKGLRRPGWGPGRMKETWFKKGHRSGAAAAHYVSIGSTRYSKEGYLQRKVREDVKKPQRNWVSVHILLWQKHHGPVPAGHAVAFKDHDKSHIVIDNLELISRAELMARNTIHKLDLRLKNVLMLRGRLNRRIHKLERKVLNANTEHARRSSQSPIRAAGNAQRQTGPRKTEVRNRTCKGRRPGRQQHRRNGEAGAQGRRRARD